MERNGESGDVYIVCSGATSTTRGLFAGIANGTGSPKRQAIDVTLWPSSKYDAPSVVSERMADPFISLVSEEFLDLLTTEERQRLKFLATIKRGREIL